MPVTFQTPGAPDLGDVESQQENRGQRGLDIVVSVHASGLAIRGMLHDLIPGELLIAVDRALPEGTPVEIELRGAKLNGEVAFCQFSHGRYEAHVQIPEADGVGLRHAPRFTVDLPARIFPADEAESVNGRIVDISAIGLGLEMPISMQPGEIVAVESDSNVTFGVVRYCRPLPEGSFRVGAETYHVMPKEKKRPARKRWLNSLISALEKL